MSIEESVQTVKNFFAALGDRDKQGLLALVAEDIEWIIPGEGWPLAGTHRGHAGLESLFRRRTRGRNSYPRPPEFIAQGDRVLVSALLREKSKPRVSRSRTIGFSTFCSKWQTDEDPGVHRHASSGAGLRDGS